MGTAAAGDAREEAGVWVWGRKGWSTSGHPRTQEGHGGLRNILGPGILWVPGGVAGVLAWTGGTVPPGGRIRAICGPSSGVLGTRSGVSGTLVRCVDSQAEWTFRGLR